MRAWGDCTNVAQDQVECQWWSWESDYELRVSEGNTFTGPDEIVEV